MTQIPAGYHALDADWCIECLLPRLTYRNGMSIEIANAVYFYPDHGQIRCSECGQTLTTTLLSTLSRKRNVKVDTSIRDDNRYISMGYGNKTYGVFDRLTASALGGHRYETWEDATAAARRLNGLATVERVAC